MHPKRESKIRVPKWGKLGSDSNYSRLGAGTTCGLGAGDAGRGVTTRLGRWRYCNNLSGPGTATSGVGELATGGSCTGPGPLSTDSVGPARGNANALEGAGSAGLLPPPPSPQAVKAVAKPNAISERLLEGIFMYFTYKKEALLKSAKPRHFKQQVKCKENSRQPTAVSTRFVSRSLNKEQVKRLIAI